MYITDQNDGNIINTTLTSGTYVATVQMQAWGTFDVKDYTFRVHSPTKVNITQLNTTNITTFNNSLTNSMLNAGFTDLTTVSKLTSGGVTAYYGNTGMGVYAYLNSTKSNCTTQKATMTFKNVQYAPTAKNSNCTYNSTMTY